MPPARLSPLDLFQRYQVPLPEVLRKDLLSEHSGFKRELGRFNWSKLHPQLAASRLKIITLCYRQDLLPQYIAFLRDHLFSNVWNDAQINTLPFLIKLLLREQKITLTTFQRILSDAAYYSAFALMFPLKLTEDLDAFFQSELNMTILQYITTLATDLDKQLCLVLLVKEGLTLAECKHIAVVLRTHPFLARQLLALDSTRSSREIKQRALHPERDMAAVLEQFPVVSQASSEQLQAFTPNEFGQLASSLEVLKANHADTVDYHLALQQPKLGFLFRLFLVELGPEIDDHLKQQLLLFIKMGCHHGLIHMGAALKEIKELKLRAKYQDLYQRFFCAYQMQELELSSDIVAFASQKNNDQAQIFRQIGQRVEAQLAVMEDKIKTSSIRQQWHEAKQNYRRNLYSLSYRALYHREAQRPEQINTASSELLALVDPELKTVIQKICLFIVNIICAAIAYARKKPEDEQGNRYVFHPTATAMGRRVRALNQEVAHQLQTFVVF